MKKKLTILSAFAVAVFSYATMSSNISSAKYLEPDYKQGAFTEDANGVCVYVCPHSDAESNCV
jgi:hypothetical protein